MLLWRNLDEKDVSLHLQKLISSLIEDKKLDTE